jgi:hypothetical protein
VAEVIEGSHWYDWVTLLWLVYLALQVVFVMIYSWDDDQRNTMRKWKKDLRLWHVLFYIFFYVGIVLSKVLYICYKGISAIMNIRLRVSRRPSVDMFAQWQVLFPSGYCFTLPADLYVDSEDVMAGIQKLYPDLKLQAVFVDEKARIMRLTWLDEEKKGLHG